MIRRPPRSTLSSSSAASDVYKRQVSTQSTGARMLYMVIERFRDGPEPIYRRFAQHGRLADEGLAYVCSWVSEDITVCYQVMQTERRQLLDAWIARWADLVEFTVLPVVSSAEAVAIMKPRL
eukprot:TRINITY_DN7796_c0_g1_i12.p1 TRINITY_DN7796_c0_g1~~TRINITY_DN7796_c0_g1_i12.p1  ORF type:complete len:122 (+),score=22.26 TRINITY_DN7796_c0_g1_i12:94-459(+)